MHSHRVPCVDEGMCGELKGRTGYSAGGYLAVLSHPPITLYLHFPATRPRYSSRHSACKATTRVE